MVRSLLVLCLVGCTGVDGDAGTNTCLDDFPATSEADFASDMWHLGCAVNPTAPTTTPCESPTVADIEDECDAAGHPCGGTILVGRDAAVCIAEAEGVELGLDGLHADLIFNHGFNLPIWSVSNVTEIDGYESSGESLSIDAATGEVLMRSQWMAMP